MLKGGLCDRGRDARRPRAAAAPRRDDADALVDRIVALAGDLAAEGRRRFGAGGVAGRRTRGARASSTRRRGVALRAVNLPWRDLALADASWAAASGCRSLLSHDVRAAAAAEARARRRAGVRTTSCSSRSGPASAPRSCTAGARSWARTAARASSATSSSSRAGRRARAARAAVSRRSRRRPRSSGRTRPRPTVQGERAAAASGDRDGTGDAASAREVAALAHADDPVARAVWARAARALGAALADAVALLDPRLIVVGGGLAEAGAQLLDPVAAELAAHARLGPPPRVVAAELGADAGCRGAALLAWRALESGRMWVSDVRLPPARRDRHDARPP